MALHNVAAQGLKLAMLAPPFCMVAYGHYPLELGPTQFADINDKSASNIGSGRNQGGGNIGAIGTQIEMGAERS
eukprot:11851530-Karenia_brevis.AAC.1